jgi:hypothetical protein
MIVYGILYCEEHGEFEVSGDVDPPLLSDQVNIWAECPECGVRCSGTAPIRKW